MGEAGFFTREDLKKASQRGRAPQQVSTETLQKLGIRGVAEMNPNARHPNIRPSGNTKNPRVCCLGEAPGGTEDEKNENFVGKAGQLLRRTIPRWGLDLVYFDNVCRTRPPDNRNPTPVELECFRPSVIEDIERLKPEIVLGFGGVPLNWALGTNYKITAARGRRFPVRFGKHECWFYPVCHPSWINRVKDGSFAKVPGREWKKYFERDIAKAFRDLDRLPKPKVLSRDEADLLKGCRALVPGQASLGDIRKELERIAKSEVVAFDLETWPLRPYAKGATWLSVAFSSFTRSVAFPIDAGSWDEDEKEELLVMVGEFFQRTNTFLAHNLAFDLEWLMFYFGEEIADPLTKWGCSEQSAYVLDERVGGKSLNFLGLQYYGLPIKDLSPDAHRKDLRGMPLKGLLRYNMIDAKYTHKLWSDQQKQIKRQRLERSYRKQMDRIPAIVAAQKRGIPVDLTENRRMAKKLSAKVEDFAAQIQKMPEVKVYTRRRGTFTPSSGQDCVTLYRDVLRKTEGVQEDGRYKTDESVLSKLKDEFPSAGLILEHRHWSKLLSTYVKPFDPENPDTLVWPDGLIHCIFNSALTMSSRLSSEYPNNQNWPKRKDKWVRKQIVAPKGHHMVSCDQGQIEARGIAIASRDKTFCRALRENLDVHMDWAEEVVRLHPPKLKEHDGNIKGVRSEIKNQLVFPAFYLAGPKSISGYTSIPLFKVEKLFRKFWDKDHFAGIKKWQNDMVEFYRRNGYVESLTGWRRRGPLSTSMIVNTPIQAMASDITIASMSSLSVKAREWDMPWLQPVLNVHDDLVFIIPDEKLEEAIEIIVLDMLEIRWEWICVPLSVEVEIGRNWYEMKEAGTYRSDEV